MLKEEYLNKKTELRKEAEKKQYNLDKEFVLSNTSVEIGDFVKDHLGTIKVEKIAVAYGFSRDYPEAVYYGVKYTKTGKSFKSKEKRNIWGSDAVNI